MDSYVKLKRLYFGIGYIIQMYQTGSFVSVNKIVFLENLNKITSLLFTQLFNTTWKVERTF